LAKLYGTFTYADLTDGAPWACEWQYEGETLVWLDLEWDEGPSGNSYCSYENADGGALAAGAYTLNLYLDGTLASSGEARIAAETVTAEAPGTPEALFDAELIPAWEILRDAGPEVLWSLAQFALDHRIQLRMSDELPDGVTATYTYSASSCELPGVERKPGTVYVSWAQWHALSWAEIAAALAHELTHADQHLEDWTRCEGCSIESEYYAWVAQLYVLQETGRTDILYDDYGALWDEATGDFDKDALWEALEATYTECPAY
jgi:hypothetical protein